MSGIVGIFHRDGAPVTQQALQPLMDELTLQGPDAQNIFLRDDVGLGHALLGHALVGHALLGHALLAPGGAGRAAAPRTALESSDAQPTALPEAQLVITGDVRLDAREALRARLSDAHRNVLPEASDALLLLHAYALWGPECTAHLRGDFAFAIWDAQAHTLFCARDHFGIKPFYYALFPELFLCSNSLAALRRHRRVSEKLNDFAVADFLLFGLNCDNAATTFQDIQRLPPAHSVLVSRDSVRLARYWSVPADGLIRYSNPGDYVEKFLEVLNSAIADRMHSGTTGILLSGGLDSASVASVASVASAAELAGAQASRGNSIALRAFTITNDFARNDQESTFAAELAASLGIPWEPVSAEYTGNPAPGQGGPATPEPVDDPFFARELSTYRKMSAQTRVLLSGEGADNLMHFEMWPYVRDLRARGEWRRLGNTVSQYAWRRPFPWRGIRTRLQNWIGAGPDSARPFPNWIAPDFAKRMDLRARWRAGQPLPIPPQPHPIHATAVASLYLPQWTRLFELESPAVTKCQVEVRYPYLDLRVAEYLLAIPPFPWFFHKGILRSAMAGRVLDSVRLRPKTPFPGDPLLLRLQRFGAVGVKSFGTGEAEADAARRGAQHRRPEGAIREEWSSEVDLYINRSSLSPVHGKMTAEQVNQMARPFCFNFWLQSLRDVGYN